MNRLVPTVVLGVVAAVVSLAAQNPPPQTPDSPPSTGVVIGTVVDESSGKPIGGAIVTIGQQGGDVPRGAPAQVLTNSDGRFLFAKLPAGLFQFSARKPGYLTGSLGSSTGTLIRPGLPILLGPGEVRSDIKIALARPASLSGTVFDENGDPVVGAIVYSLRRQRNRGRLSWFGGTSDTTDDRGVYRFGDLPPGDRIVMVEQTNASVPTSAIEAYQKSTENQRPLESNPLSDELFSTGATPLAGGTPSARLINSQSQTLNRTTVQPRVDDTGHLFVYPSVIYPGTTSVAKASIITLRPGEDRTGIDITLRPVKTITISGTVTGPDGPVGLTAITLSTPEPIEGRNLPNQVGTMTDVSGAFTFIAVPPGDYTLRVTRIPPVRTASTMVMNTVQNSDGSTSMTGTSSGPAVVPPLPPDPTLWVEQRVSAGNRDITGLSIVLQPGARLSGRTEFKGTAPRPTAKDFQTLQLSLAPIDGMRAFRTPRTRFDEKGDLTTQGMPSGRYTAQLFGTLPKWSLLSATSGGVDILQHPLEIGVSDISDIVVTFTNAPSELSGTVTERGVEPPKEALVIAFPADEPLVPDDPNLRRQVSTRAASNGSFSFKNLPPGDYQVIAINDASRATDLTADFLQSLVGKATRVKVGAGEKRSQSLSLVTIR
ncbi:MAG: hypothetical protein EPO35_00330 [Acidobacteria bacterium]|nr:MAG: hypothetical protein EPO35_00330 [Acidobacteriota bacterium]